MIFFYDDMPSKQLKFILIWKHIFNKCIILCDFYKPKTVENIKVKKKLSTQYIWKSNQEEGGCAKIFLYYYFDLL